MPRRILAREPLGGEIDGAKLAFAHCQIGRLPPFAARKENRAVARFRIRADDRMRGRSRAFRILQEQFQLRFGRLLQFEKGKHVSQPRLKVELASVDELAPYVGNAKLHSAEQIDQIAASIEQFGFNDPIGVWTNSEGVKVIVEGHGRLMAAKLLGIDKVPIIKLDHLDDDARRAYVHVHNQTTLTSGFDYGILDEELRELEFDWEEFGFDTFSSAIEWANGVEELTDENFQEPEKDLCQCPQCGHVDSRERFVKVQ